MEKRHTIITSTAAIEKGRGTMPLSFRDYARDLADLVIRQNVPLD